MRMAERPLDAQGLPEGYPLQPEWEVTPRAGRAMREAGQDFVLLDVREPREMSRSHVRLVQPDGSSLTKDRLFPTGVAAE